MSKLKNFSLILSMEITDHGYKRLKERCGWNKKAADRMIPRVWEDGKGYDQCKSKLQKYIGYFYKRSKREHEKKNSVIKIYGNQIFIFSLKKLITVWNIPPELVKYNKL